MKELLVQSIYDEISKYPYEVGIQKTGDLNQVYVLTLRYQRTDYKIGYQISDEEISILIIGIGTHENFYKTIKSYLY